MVCATTKLSETAAASLTGGASRESGGLRDDDDAANGPALAGAIVDLRERAEVHCPSFVRVARQLHGASVEVAVAVLDDPVVWFRIVQPFVATKPLSREDLPLH